MGNRTFSRTGSIRPGRSAFNLSYEKKLTCDMGQLIPVMCDEVVPGDYFSIGNEAVVRFQAMVAPILHEINITTHYFFCPTRIVWDDFEDFITKGVDGDYETLPPSWNPTDTSVGSLWDYMGFPTGVNPAGAYPLDFCRRIYNKVYNDFYRDETLQTEVLETNESILNRAWEKDYFTSALPWQQRGPSVALPITGTGSALWPASSWQQASEANSINFSTTASDPVGHIANATALQNAKDFLDSNTIDFSTASTFDVADMRLVFQVQRWMERNARAGVRYTEFLGAHFGVSPRDDRLDRPEYIGGSKSPVMVSEVLQTSSTDATTPQGNLAGHGLGLVQEFCGKYHVKEFGYIIGIMSIMPRTNYQQGINRQWLRETPYDWPFPEFVNLSEQAVTNAELIAIDSDSTHNTGIFGYQGRYDEMRYKPNMVCGEMRDTFDYWHLGRKFNPASPPSLNADFIECDPDDTKRIFAVQDEPGLIVSFANLIKAVRPIPIESEPGLIDHN